MNCTTIKRLLKTSIKEVAEKHELYSVNPGKDFTRTRKLPIEKLLSGLIGMSGKSLTNELIDMFNTSSDMPSTSALVQQRSKLKPEAFGTVFESFTNKINKPNTNKLRMLAVDGSAIRIPFNPEDKTTYMSGGSTQSPYNKLHLNALYDIEKKLYVSVNIQDGMLANEHKALQQMVDISYIPLALVIADRGYESYNNLAHIQEKGWFFLFRIKDGYEGIKEGLVLPDNNEFDSSFSLKLCKKNTNELKELYKNRNEYRRLKSNRCFDYLPVKSKKKDPVVFYTLNFRIARFAIAEDTYETVITNLDSDTYPPEKLKELYASRWGIETSFRDLKHTLGLLKFHSKKAMCIRQEIYAQMIMYNFVEMITSSVAIKHKPRKRIYKANFSVATHVCRLFYLGKTSPPKVESTICKNLIPIRPNRHFNRTNSLAALSGFFYRVA